MLFEHRYHPPAPGERCFIDIPEELVKLCGIKGMTQVEGTINETPFRCGLLPRGNGRFSISFTKALHKQVKPREGDWLKIELKVAAKTAGVPVAVASPRRIDKLELVMQNKGTSCGQACVAMLAGKPIEQVIKDMRTSGPTTIGQLIGILDTYQISHAPKNIRLSKKNPSLPRLALVTLHIPEAHWSVYYNGRFYDPQYGLLDALPEHARATSFLEIFSS